MPGLTPPIKPVLVPIVAIAVALLLQVPPTVASLSVVVAPVHTVGPPAIGDGTATTVMGAVA